MIISTVSAQIAAKDPIDIFKDKYSIEVSKDLTATKVVDKRVYDLVTPYSNIRIASSQDMNWPELDTFDVEKKGFITYSFSEGYVLKKEHLICDKASFSRVGKGYGATRKWDYCINYTPQWEYIETYDYLGRLDYDRYNKQNFTKVSDKQIIVHHVAGLDPSVTDYQEGMVVCLGFEETPVDSTGNYSGALSGTTNYVNTSITGYALNTTSNGYWRSNATYNFEWDEFTILHRIYMISAGMSIAMDDQGGAEHLYAYPQTGGILWGITGTGSGCTSFTFQMPDISTKTWYSSAVVGSAAATDCWMYRDGSLEYTDTTFTDGPNLNDYIFIGKEEAGFHFSALIDEVMIWNYPLISTNLSYLHDNNITCDDIFGAGSNCTPSIVNTSWSAWANWTDGTCDYTQNRSATRYDANDCGAANTTIWQNQTLNDSSGYNDCGAGCQRCNGAGSCADDNAQCTTTDCYTGTCSADACTIYQDGGEHGCAACTACTDPDSACDVINNTGQDVGGTNLCNSTCKECQSGSCVNQAANEDLFSQCTKTCYENNTITANGLCNGAGACNVTSYDCPACQFCNASDTSNTTCQYYENNVQDKQLPNKCEDNCTKCSEGSCIAQTLGEDLFTQCPSVQCDVDTDVPFYFGWVSQVCQYFNDTQGTCDGVDSCQSQSAECNASIDGPATAITATCVDAQVNCTYIYLGVDNASACTNCTPTWQANYTPCNYSDERIKTYWDFYNCSNSTGIPGDNNTEASCNYCSYDLNTTISAWSAWSNITDSCGTRSRNTTIFDQDWPICCNLTYSLATGDCYSSDNGTFTTTYNSTTNQSSTCASTGTCATRGDMTMIAIVLFILSITGGLIILPFVKRDFVLWRDKDASDIVNMIFRRGCWVIAAYLTVMNSAIVATGAEAAGLDVTAELFQYMWLAGMFGYLFMGALVLSTMFSVMGLWRLRKENKRMGTYD